MFFLKQDKKDFVDNINHKRFTNLTSLKLKLL